MKGDAQKNAPLALVVEDQPQLAEVFCEALAAAGYETAVAADGLEAMDCLDHCVPDIVVMDLHLPYIPGQIVLNRIRHDASYADTLVFLATADAAGANEHKDEADLVLLKPISYNQLRDLSRRFVAKTATGMLSRAAN